MSGAETARRRVVQRRIGGAESRAPKRRRRNGPPPCIHTNATMYIHMTQGSCDDNVQYIMTLIHLAIILHASLYIWCGTDISLQTCNYV